MLSKSPVLKSYYETMLDSNLQANYEEFLHSIYVYP